MALKVHPDFLWVKRKCQFARRRELLWLCIKARSVCFRETEETQLQTDPAITGTASMWVLLVRCWRCGCLRKTVSSWDCNVCVCFVSRMKVLALMTLLMVSVESDLSNEEWKSLSNPQTRTLVSQTALFFILLAKTLADFKR